jgi:hypothetical protein
VVRGMCETGVESKDAIRLMAEGGEEVWLPKAGIGRGRDRWHRLLPVPF